MPQNTNISSKNTNGPTWAVVATVDEPAVLIAAFARHHLAVGASEIHLFLDRPHPELPRLIEGLQGCFVTLCDDNYWAGSTFGKRPAHHIRRQKHNANIANSKTKCGWLLHCDADEFIRDADALYDEMASLELPTPEGEPHYDGVKIFNCERVWCPDMTIDAPLENTWGQSDLFSGKFRFPTWLYDDVLRAQFRPFGMFLNRGVSGHARGKSLTRVSATLDIGIHDATDLNTGVVINRLTSKAVLHHFDGLTPLHYLLKMLKRGYETPHGPRKRNGVRRTDQARFVRRNAGDAAKLERFVRTIKSLTSEQRALYHSVAAFDETPFTVLGSEGLDFSADHFNAALRSENAAFFQTVGLAYWGD
jgi:hypothetical protein